MLTRIPLSVKILKMLSHTNSWQLHLTVKIQPMGTNDTTP